MALGKRFIFGITAIICTSITFGVFKWGLESEELVIKLANIYATVVGGITGAFTLAQSITDVKKNGGGHA